MQKNYQGSGGELGNCSAADKGWHVSHLVDSSWNQLGWRSPWSPVPKGHLHTVMSGSPFELLCLGGGTCNINSPIMLSSNSHECFGKVYVYVCVCVREREREREKIKEAAEFTTWMSTMWQRGRIHKCRESHEQVSLPLHTDTHTHEFTGILRTITGV